MHDEPNRLPTSSNMLATVGDDAGITEAGERGDKALAGLDPVERKRDPAQSAPVAAAVPTCANVGLRRRREKVFQNHETRVPLDREAKVRITRLAEALKRLKPPPDPD